MKLRSHLAMIPVLLGLLTVPALSQASLVYGTFVNNAFLGSISATETNGTLKPGYFNLRSASLLSSWSLAYRIMTSMTNSVDSHLNYHSVVKATVFFTDSHTANEYATAEADITIWASGLQTVGLKVNDYFNPNILLYTSGTATEGSIRQLPINAGGFEIVL